MTFSDVSASTSYHRREGSVVFLSFRSGRGITDAHEYLLGKPAHGAGSFALSEMQVQKVTSRVSAESLKLIRARLDIWRACSVLQRNGHAVLVLVVALLLDPAAVLLAAASVGRGH
jgi:hypothetical protein